MLLYRIITAAFLIPITLLLLFFLPPIEFGLLTIIIILFAAWEWSYLMGIKTNAMRLSYLMLVLFMVCGSFFIPIPAILVFSFLWWLFASLLIIFYPHGSTWWNHSIIWRGLVGFCVLVPCLIAINFIRNQVDGIYALLFLFILVWGADSAAYFVGRKWGRTKLAPRVSPKKSVEGVVGAILYTILAVLLIAYIAKISSRFWFFGIFLSLITILFSVVGDLFESMIKRQAHVKDSGKVLPGHGGLLDRIDSLTAAAPIFALGALLLGMYFD